MNGPVGRACSRAIPGYPHSWLGSTLAPPKPDRFMGSNPNGLRPMREGGIVPPVTPPVIADLEREHRELQALIDQVPDPHRPAT